MTNIAWIYVDFVSNHDFYNSKFTYCVFEGNPMNDLALMFFIKRGQESSQKSPGALCDFALGHSVV